MVSSKCSSTYHQPNIMLHICLHIVHHQYVFPSPAAHHVQFSFNSTIEIHSMSGNAVTAVPIASVCCYNPYSVNVINVHEILVLGMSGKTCFHQHYSNNIQALVVEIVTKIALTNGRQQYVPLFFVRCKYASCK